MKKFLNNVKYIFKENPAISMVLVFSFFVIFAMLVYVNSGMLASGDDHYFHFRFAQEMHNNGFFNSFRDFKSIYFTKVAQGDYFIYYNFLYYFVVLPFTYITPLYLGIKLYAIFIFGLIGLALYFIFNEFNIKYSFIWAVAFFSCIGVPSFWRLFISRPYVFAPILLLLLLVALYKRNYLWIFIISFVYLFWHGATFFFPIIISTIYLASHNLYTRKFEWKSLIYSVLGVTVAVFLAYILGTGFFNYIYDNILSIFINNIASHKVMIHEGSELYPKLIFDFIIINKYLFTLYFVSIISHIRIFIKEINFYTKIEGYVLRSRVVMMTLFLTSFALIPAVTNISQRFSDFFIFIAWLYIAYIINESLKDVVVKSVIKQIAIITFLITSICLLGYNGIRLHKDIENGGSNPSSLIKIGEYLSENLKDNEVVFNVNWGWFPQLYFHAPRQNYVIGLEPKLTYEYDSRLYFIWFHVGEGYFCDISECPEIKSSQSNLRDENSRIKWYKEQGDLISKVIISDFHSQIIISSISYTRLNAILDNNKHFKQVVSDKNGYLVYMVN